MAFAGDLYTTESLTLPGELMQPGRAACGNATAPQEVGPGLTCATLQSRRAVRSIRIAGPAGRLEAVLNEGAPESRFAALVCHPHPLGGGNLHNKVVYRAMKALNTGSCSTSLTALGSEFAAKANSFVSRPG